ncbi:MAG: EpsG family protein, partial [Nitrososphaerales archaeon]
AIVQRGREYNGYKILFFTLPPLILGFYYIALRPFYSGGDTIPYLAAFNRISSPFTAISDASYGSELLFWPVQAILKLFVNERGWLIANYLIIVSLTYVAYKKTTDGTRISPLIFSLVFLTFFAVFSGNAMRQVYSIPLGLIAFHYCYRREYIKFLMLAALAISFHWAAAVILVSPLFTRLPNRNIYYIGIPVVALSCSLLIEPVVDFITNIAGFNWLAFKVELYFKGGKVSHIQAVWKTVNFWLCVSLYLSLIITNITTDEKHEKATKYLLMFISMMLFAVNNPDVSERYMVWFLFLVPLAVTVLLSKLKVSHALRNCLFMVSFCTMAILVFTRESATLTLGVAQ